MHKVLHFAIGAVVTTALVLGVIWLANKTSFGRQITGVALA